MMEINRLSTNLSGVSKDMASLTVHSTKGTVAYWFHPDTKLDETTCPFIKWKEGNDQTIHYKWAGDRFSLTRGTMLTESMTMADAPEGVTSKTQGRNPN